ncbi:MAG TPA: NPCBM/NEW2 domain-containing protein, partial [Candidatus Hydrogenedentes bacterium]|nr:NPCBM/NEW2 domain-containing protein [Candidatus Hydrogenedentota bacterium]
MKISPMIMALLSGITAMTAIATPLEMANMRAWVAARFGEAAPADDAGSLSILSHFDIVWQNCRVDLPLTLGATAYDSGLFTHAPAEILVTLPGPGKMFHALVGVDTNDQTRGGRGSVV